MARCEDGDYSDEDIQQERGPEVREPGAQTQRNSVEGRGQRTSVSLSQGAQKGVRPEAVGFVCLVRSFDLMPPGALKSFASRFWLDGCGRRQMGTEARWGGDWRQKGEEERSK